MTSAGATRREKGYHRLETWKEAHRLVLAVYSVTATFPRAEVFGLTTQMRRAAVSVAANIVEGQAREGNKEFLRFLTIANGSLAELEYHLELARDLQFLTQEQYEGLDNVRHRVGYLLHGFMEVLSRQGDQSQSKGSSQPATASG